MVEPKTVMRLKNEFKKIKKKKLEGVTVTHKNKEGTIWNFLLIAPKGCPYEGGKFNVKADLSQGYPYKPPLCKFITKIYHPQVNIETGEICSSIYEDKWVATNLLLDVIILFMNFIQAPNPHDNPLSGDIAK